jgi:hypothetical protein
VPDIDLNEAYAQYGSAYYTAALPDLKALGESVYAEGKWTIKQIIQHLIDTERIFQYRALRFARRDHTLLPGFDEDYFAKSADVGKRSLEDLIDEWHAVNTSGQKMFSSFTAEDLQSKGVAFNSNISVLSIGFIIAGHAIHHMNIIKERYIGKD